MASKLVTDSPDDRADEFMRRFVFRPMFLIFAISTAVLGVWLIWLSTNSIQVLAAAVPALVLSVGFLFLFTKTSREEWQRSDQ